MLERQKEGMRWLTNSLFVTPSPSRFVADRRVCDLFPSTDNSYVITENPVCMHMYDCWTYLNRPTCSLIFSFVWGLIFSPWTQGLFYMILFIVIYELIYYIAVWGDLKKWDPYLRGGMILAYILGWLVGRTFLVNVLFPNQLPAQTTKRFWHCVDGKCLKRLH